MQRPKVFLSSTIYDFSDLRSGIKFFLERQGCQVLASEFNDFTKPLDTHSYQACLETIGQSNLFILLVGSRIGGWFDKPNKISITRQEYRVAYDLQRAGRLKLLSFVRRDIWNFRDNLKSLERHLANMEELSQETREKITNYPNRLVNDASYIVEFIEEIGRNSETAAAVSGTASFPVGNWLHLFSSFSEIIDAVEPHIFSGISVDDAAARKALQIQLIGLLQSTLLKIRKTAMLPRETIKKLASAVDLRGPQLSGEITIDGKTWRSLSALVVMVSRMHPLAEPFQAALASSLLLQYEPQNSRYRETEAYEALGALVEQIRLFNAAQTGFDLTSIVRPGPIAPGQSVRAPAHHVAGALQLLLRWADVVGLAGALILCLDGKPLEMPDLMPVTPFVDLADEMEAERVTAHDVRLLFGLAEPLGAQAGPLITVLTRGNI